MKFILVLTAMFCTTANSQTPMNARVVLTTANTVVFRDVITAESVQKAQVQLTQQVILRGARDYTIYLVLDSPGGSIDDGMTFIEFAKTIPNLKTVTIFSASMASAIVEALPGERLITGNGYTMFHRASGGFRGQFNDGEVETRLIMARRIVGRMEIINSQRMQLPLDAYKQLVKDELWLDAEQSFSMKSVDRIVDLYCTPTLISATDSITIEMLFMTAELKFSKCPLFRAPVFAPSNVKFKYKVPTFENYDSIVKRSIGAGK